MNEFVKEIASTLKQDRTKPYDTVAKVLRVDEKTAYVHIEGGAEETPAQMAINCKTGDTVKIRVSGGKAWITGNITSPPTDDSSAQTAQTAVEAVAKSYGEFVSLTTENFKAVNADIEKLNAKKLDVESADIKFANIDFSNIGKAAMEYFYAQSGLIKDVVVGDQKITGHLIGVTISGDLIEGNTVKAEKLVVLGEDGLYYKLNVNALGEAVASSDAKYQNGLDGSVIIAKSVTAEKVSVKDLVAFGATIGGLNITDGSLYSGVKDSINNTTQGFYVDKNGQLYLGDATNFLRYYKAKDGTYKLAISAKSVTLGSNQNLEEAWEETKTTIESKIETVDVEYYLSISPTSLSGGSWSTTAPTWTDGKYMWMRTKITDGAGNVTYSPDENGTCIAGATGATGATGSSGKGIASIVEEYYQSTSATSLSGGSWSTIAPTWTDGKYIWTRSVITYTDATIKRTEGICATGQKGDIGPQGVQGEKGDTGEKGEDGKNGTNLWINPLFESGKPQLGTLDTSIKAPNGSAVNLLNNRDHHNNETAFPVFPGHSYRITTYRKKKSGTMDLNAGLWYTAATSGKAWDTYVAATSVKELADDWQEAVYNFTCPDGKSKGCVFFQIEQDKTVHDTAWYIANIVCADITGLKGETGAKGEKGEAGKGIKSTTITYQLGVSGTTVPTGTWLSSPPSTDVSKPYLWTKIVITYDDGTTSNPAYSVSSTLDSLQVGGRNLLLNSAFKNDRKNWSDWGTPATRELVTSNNKVWAHIVGNKQKFQGYNQWTGSGSVKTGDKITFSARIKGNASNQKFTVGIHWINNNTILDQAWNEFTVGTTDAVYTWTTTASGDNCSELNLMVGVSDTSAVHDVYFTELKLEKGTIATDWTPAPEDLEARLTAAETDISQNTEAITLAATKEEVANKLAGYSTTEEMNAALSVKANEINSEVEKVKDDVMKSKSIVSQTADKIALLIKSGDTETTLEVTEGLIKALIDKIVISSPDGETIVEGGKLKTRSIKSDAIDVNDLFAQDITATGKIAGIELEGATGKIGGWNIKDSELSASASDNTKEVVARMCAKDESGFPLLTLKSKGASGVIREVKVYPYGVEVSGDKDGAWSNQIYLNPDTGIEVSTLDKTSGRAKGPTLRLKGNCIQFEDTIEGYKNDYYQIEASGQRMKAAGYQNDQEYGRFCFELFGSLNITDPFSSTQINGNYLDSCSARSVLHSYGNSQATTGTTNGTYVTIPAFTKISFATGGTKFAAKKSNTQLQVSKEGLYIFVIRVAVKSNTAFKRLMFAPYINSSKVSHYESNVWSPVAAFYRQILTYPLMLEEGDTLDFRVAPQEGIAGTVGIDDIQLYCSDYTGKYE